MILRGYQDLGRQAREEILDHDPGIEPMLGRYGEIFARGQAIPPSLEQDLDDRIHLAAIALGHRKAATMNEAILRLEHTLRALGRQILQRLTR